MFEKDGRSLSSGCARVHDMKGLIDRMGRYQNMSTQFTEGHRSDTTIKVMLEKKIPIYFVYFTAWPDAKGRIRFRKDIYQLDNALNSWF